MATEILFNQAALKQLANGAELASFMRRLGDEVAIKANNRARALFTPRGGGGIGSVEARLDSDERGTFVRIGYPPQFWYMNLHEVGTEHERPRPHLRPALYATRRGTGAADSAIRSVRQDRGTRQRTSRLRALHKRKR